MTPHLSGRSSEPGDGLSVGAAASERPDGAAIITDGKAYTFSEVWARTRAMIDALAREPGTGPVAVVAALRVETLLAFYALLELGRPIVPVHPRLTENERTTLLASIGVTVLLDERWLSRPWEAVDAPAPTGKPPVDPESPLAILFTSGSSGSPKGVELSRRAFLAAAAASADNLGWQPSDRWLLCMPLGHVGGLSIVVRCLLARVPVVLSPWTGSVRDLLDDVARFEVTLLSFVPTMLSRILDEGAADMSTPLFPRCVRAVLLGGDSTGSALLEAAVARHIPVLTTYGMTEACSQIATLSPSEPPSPAAGVGRPLKGTEVRIVDGEVQIRGRSLFNRYLPADGFPAPFLEGGWFRTGDLGHLDDAGRLHVTGRRSDTIITGGENVDPREVEIALTMLPGIREACVFGIPDARWGQIVGAAVVLDANTPVTLASIRHHVQTTLAAHKRPRRIAFCAAFVVNGSSKLDRRATLAQIEQDLAPL